jgi:hypothetical protein
LDISVEGSERERGIRRKCLFLKRGENFFKNQRGEKTKAKTKERERKRRRKLNEESSDRAVIRERSK